MAVTLKQMRDRIRTEINKPSTAYESFIDDDIRSAIAFHSDAKYWFLEAVSGPTLANAASGFLLPSDFGMAIMLRASVSGQWISENNGFKQSTYQSLRNTYTSVTDTGSPAVWALFGNSVYVNQIANADYLMELSYYAKDAVPPIGDDDMSIWFDDGADLIRNRAMEFFYRDRLHTPDAADTYKAQADIWAGKLTVKHNLRAATAGLLRG